MRRVRVLRHVVKGLQTREIHGGLGVLGEPADLFSAHFDGKRGFLRLGPQGSSKSLVGQKRWVDAPRKIAKILERGRCFALYVGHQLVGPSGVALDQRVGEPKLHSECDQLLLRSVVDVAFELAPLLILGCNQSLARSAEILDQSGVSKHEPGL